MHTVSGAGRPSTACRPCKSQKVRCSGDLPSCKRCLRLRRLCLYPDNRLHPHNPRSRANLGPTEPPLRQQLRPSQTDGASPLQNRHLSPFDISNDARMDIQLGVPPQLVLDLIGTFFTHACNADLLLHKETFLRDQSEGRVPQHVLLSLCAFAAIFHRDSNGHNSLKQHGFASQWAERAARLVLKEVEMPTEDNVVSFLTLALFWYSQGNWRRSYIHKGNAMQTAHILRLANSRSDNHSPLTAELSRRRFWACFLMNCHSSDSMFATDPPMIITCLPLPWDEWDFAAGVSTRPSTVLESKSTNTGICAELVRVMSYWSAAHSLVKSPDANSENRLNAIYHLDTKISKWWSDLPENLRMDTSTLSQTRRKDLPRLVLINAIYYQCYCVMHSSIVPLYSWGKEEQVPVLALQLSAQIAYDNACALSELFQAILKQFSDLNDFNSFVGYAAYCGCAIQIPFMGCSDVAVRERATKNVRGNLQIIHTIGLNWKFVALLGRYAEYIMDVHAKHPLQLTNEPKWLPPNKLNGFRIVASKARASILEHNAVLWKEDGVSAQGDEETDLGFGNEQPATPTQTAPVNDLHSAEAPSPDASRTTHSSLSGIPPSFRRPISPSWEVSPQEVSPQEFFQPLLDASDLFQVLPEYDLSFAGHIDMTDWQPNPAYQT